MLEHLNRYDALELLRELEKRMETWAYRLTMYSDSDAQTKERILSEIRFTKEVIREIRSIL